MQAFDALFVVTGCSGGGKSSLLDELARRGHSVMPEPGRIIVREELEGAGEALPWVDLKKFAERAIDLGARFYREAAILECPIFFDRSILDAIAALERVGEDVVAYDPLVSKYRYANTVFMAPPWRDLFEADEERQHGFDAAVAEYEDLCRFYPVQGYDVLELPKLPLSARADFVEENVRKLI